MNKERAKLINTALASLEDAKVALEQAASDEREAFDNMPEGLQQGERGQAIEANADYLDEAVGSVEEAIDGLGNIELP